MSPTAEITSSIVGSAPWPIRAESKDSIAMIVGTVESGLFVGRSSMVVVASPTGVEVLTPPAGTESG